MLKAKEMLNRTKQGLKNKVNKQIINIETYINNSAILGDDKLILDIDRNVYDDKIFIEFIQKLTAWGYCVKHKDGILTIGWGEV